MRCRHCNHELVLSLIDLGASPHSNAYLSTEDLSAPEKYFPLHVLVCRNCYLVQTEDYSMADELFTADYAYFSSYSTSWLSHSELYVANAAKKFGINNESMVIEVAANDGYLLQYVSRLGIPCLGIEPTSGTAKAAREKGLEIIEDFFGMRLANKLVQIGRMADLTIANNVLAHVPDINDFVGGFSILLKPTGVATFEFPHLLKMVKLNQFDTIYHEHYSYLSLTAVDGIFEKNGLKIFDVEELDTHGGSLRIYAQRKNEGIHDLTTAVSRILREETVAGVTSDAFYQSFNLRANAAKDKALSLLIDLKHSGKKIVGYGAAAKGNTFMNYAGIKADLIPCVIDKNPAKQKKFLPGSRIPIVDEGVLREIRPDYIFIMPWNLKKEVMHQLAYTRDWGCKFITAIPELEIE